jgi:signal transduction histidine kinase
MPQVAQAAVGPALEHAIDKTMPLLRRKNLRLDVAIADDLALVAVKETVLRQLAQSLLENACGATRENGGVLIRAEMVAVNGSKPATSRVAALVVADTGPGIALDDRARVFNPLAEGGRPITGLGVSVANLAAARKLARESGGDLDFDSQEGGGATFTLRLPAADVQPWTSLKTKQAAPSGRGMPTEGDPADG